MTSMLVPQLGRQHPGITFAPSYSNRIQVLKQRLRIFAACMEQIADFGERDRFVIGESDANGGHHGVVVLPPEDHILRNDYQLSELFQCTNDLFADGLLALSCGRRGIWAAIEAPH